MIRTTKALCLVGLLLIVVALAACGASPTTVRFQFFGDAEEIAIYKRIAETFHQSHPNINVELINVPSQGDHGARLAAAFNAGNPPDVFLVNYRRYAQFAAQNALNPVEPLMERDGVDPAAYYDVALDAFRWQGQLQCLPQNISSLVVYYNRDLFERSGVPLPAPGWSWSAFVEAATRLTSDTDGDGAVDVYGLGVEPELVRLAPFIWQAGGQLVDDPTSPTRLTLDDPNTAAAVRWFIGLRAESRAVPSEAEAKAEDLETRFRNGKLAMLLNSRRVVPTLRTIDSFTWDVAPLPMDKTPATVLHSDAYCLAAGSPNAEAAWSFVRFAAGPDGQRIGAELGRIVPSLRAVAESPAFLEPDRAPASSQVFLDVIPSMRVLPVTPAWPALEESFNQEFELAFYANDESELAGAAAEEEAEGGPISPAAQQLIDAALKRADEAARKTFAQP